MTDTIFYYCSQNDTEGLNRLIENGMGVTEKENGQGDTPLHVATYYGFFECMEILIKAGANVNEKNDVGYAAWFGLPDCLQLLMEHGADPDIKSNNGGTPLIHAAFNVKSSKESIKILLKYGADPTIKNDYGKTFLDYITDKTLKKEIEDYIQELSMMHIKEPSY